MAVSRSLAWRRSNGALHYVSSNYVEDVFERVRME